MEKKETIEFMNRIKQHYQDFIIDDSKIKEWHNELKKYDLEDVNKKLEDHLRSEQFGGVIPKLYFLTKYLTPAEQKGLIKHYIVSCTNCGCDVNLENFDRHYARCIASDYLLKKFEELKVQKKIDKQTLLRLNDEKFDEIYNWVANRLYEKLPEGNEKKRIENVLYGNINKINDIM